MTKLYKNKTFIRLLVVLAMSTLLSSCSFKDIDKRAFILGIGIDPAEENKGYKVTLKLAIPMGTIKDVTEPMYSYLSYEGETIGEAIRMMEANIDKILEFGHAKVIVINEKLLATELQDIMDYFVRRGDIQLISYIAATKSTAEKILKVQPKTESVASIALDNFFDNNGTESPYIVTTFLFQFRRDFLGEGISPVLPIIKTDDDENELIIENALVVKFNKKPVELTPVQTKYLNTLVNKAMGFSYKISGEDLKLIVNIQDIRMKYKIIKKNGSSPVAKITIHKTGVIGEANQRLHLKDLEKYNKLTEKVMKENVIDLLTTLQQNDVDPFGFGLRYRTTKFNDKNTVDEWNKMYQDLEFDVTLKVSLKSTGAIE